ncbi:MAG: hypothetical protein A2293_14490 [Elusimicrobia bacterium RIFOXYB2_FULL_49_7]|nr:MAG: hypothetical protein A2293_14490 [Elusimicrobia bacterium RIFOXYB2_FULL_49_7]
MTGQDDFFETEENAWIALTPVQRMETYFKLFEFYRAAGGSLAPERDSQSPFDFAEYYKESVVL